MSVRIDVRYEGRLHCVAVHAPSGERLWTDAPVDNEGRGESFSPTDLVGTAMGTCMLTILGIVARKQGVDIEGAGASVLKEMSAVPRRHISRLVVRLTLPARLTAKQRTVFERAARGCPVYASLGPNTEVDLSFEYV